MPQPRIARNRAWFLILPAFAVLAIGGIAPILTAINYSLHDSFGGDRFIWVGLRWYEEMLREAEFWAALGRTLGFFAASLALQIALGIAVARKLYHVQLRPELLIPLLSLPLLTPWIVVGFLWRHMMQPEIGLFGTALTAAGLPPDLNDSATWAWAVILAMDVWHWTGIVVILCYAGYLSIPRAHFQAASIDGANAWQTFRHIELPRLRTVLIIAALIRMADGLMIYIEPFMVTRGGPHMATTFLSQDIIQTGLLEFNLGHAGASSVVYLLVVVPLAWALYRAMGRDR